MVLTVKIKNLFFVLIICIISLIGSITLATVTNTENDKKIALPILMYHSIKKDNSYSPKYIVTPEIFENDLKYLKENGYNSVTMKDVENYVYNGKKLPKKPVIITFDDGYYNNYHYAYPIAKKYNMKFIISVVEKYSDMFSEKDDSNPEYSHLTWKQIEELQNSGLVEIQNHSYNLHTISKERNGCKINENEDLKSYEKLLENDLKKLQNKLAKSPPNTFVYPFGAMCEESEKVAKKMGFIATFSCENGINYISRDKNCLYKMKRIIRTSKDSTDVFFNNLSM